MTVLHNSNYSLFSPNESLDENVVKALRSNGTDLSDLDNAAKENDTFTVLADVKGKEDEGAITNQAFFEGFEADGESRRTMISGILRVNATGEEDGVMFVGVRGVELCKDGDWVGNLEDEERPMKLYRVEVAEEEGDGGEGDGGEGDGNEGDGNDGGDDDEEENGGGDDDDDGRSVRRWVVRQNQEGGDGSEGDGSEGDGEGGNGDGNGDDNDDDTDDNDDDGDVEDENKVQEIDLEDERLGLVTLGSGGGASWWKVVLGIAIVVGLLAVAAKFILPKFYKRASPVSTEPTTDMYEQPSQQQGNFEQFQTTL